MHKNVNWYLELIFFSLHAKIHHAFSFLAWTFVTTRGSNLWGRAYTWHKHRLNATIAFGTSFFRWAEFSSGWNDRDLKSYKISKSKTKPLKSNYVLFTVLTTHQVKAKQYDKKCHQFGSHLVNKYRFRNSDNWDRNCKIKDVWKELFSLICVI